MINAALRGVPDLLLFYFLTFQLFFIPVCQIIQKTIGFSVRFIPISESDFKREKLLDYFSRVFYNKLVLRD